MVGSLEDLWPFNEEIVARAIYDSKLPIVSAVGHETDFTISDFVADLRAPTPSAAAELVCPNINDIKKEILNNQKRLASIMTKKIEYMKLRYEKAISSRIFKDPLYKVNEQYIYIDQKIKNMINIFECKIKESKIKAMALTTKLDELSPLKTLTRGYCIVQKDNTNVKTAKNLKQGDIINLKFVDGTKKATIN